MRSISTSSTLRRTGTAALIAALALAAGCSSMSEREQGTAKGAGAGAVAGAIIGSVTGGSAGRGAVIGGAVGAVAGNLWSKRMAREQVGARQCAIPVRACTHLRTERASGCKQLLDA